LKINRISIIGFLASVYCPPGLLTYANSHRLKLQDTPENIVVNNQHKRHPRYQAGSNQIPVVFGYAQQTTDQRSYGQKNQYNGQLPQFQPDIKGQQGPEQAILLPQKTAKVRRKTQSVNQAEAERKKVAGVLRFFPGHSGEAGA
jgi:hypothetical protein